MCFIACTHKFYKNLGSTSKFLALEGWHEACSILRTHIFIRRHRTKCIAHATWRPGFVHPRFSDISDAYFGKYPVRTSAGTQNSLSFSWFLQAHNYMTEIKELICDAGWTTHRRSQRRTGSFLRPHLRRHNLKILYKVSHFLIFHTTFGARECPNVQYM